MERKKTAKWDYRNPEELKPYEKNAKLHDQRQIKNVAESIKKFGWVQPIVVDANDVVVIGHCRLLAAKKLGLKEVPVIRVDHLTEEQVRELRIADNKTNESPWDFGMIEAELADLNFDGFDFDFGISTLDDVPDGVGVEREEYSYNAPGGTTPPPEARADDPYLPEPYDEEMANEYAQNSENYVVKRRIIITYLPEQEKELMAKIGIPGEGVTKVVYDITELAK